MKPLITETVKPLIIETVEPMLEPINERLDVLEKGHTKIEDGLHKLDARQDSFEARMDSVEAKMDSFDARMDSFEARMDRFEEVLQSVHESQLRVELEWLPKIQLALENTSINSKAISAHDVRIAALEKTTLDQDNRIFKLEHTAKAI